MHGSMAQLFQYMCAGTSRILAGEIVPSRGTSKLGLGRKEALEGFIPSP